MRNLRLITVCLVMGMMVIDCSAVYLLRKQRKSDSKLKTFTERYALPTNVHSLSSKLPLTYGYRFTDDYGTMQSREEKTDPNGSKTGSYSFVDASGLYRKVDYIADHHGFRATVTTNEPGTIAIHPADVRILSDNKHINLGDLNHATGIAPQLEYSSHIFSRFNLTNDYRDEKGNFQNSALSLGGGSSSKSPAFESERLQFEKPKLQNVESYKGNPVSFSPEITSLLQQLDDPEPAIHGNTHNINSNNYFNNPNSNPELIYNDKAPKVEYKKKVPTRYPRRHRNSRIRAKKRQMWQIHIPKGYENRHDLPLYLDK